VISLAAIKGAVQTAVTAYRVGVVVFELVRTELRQEPKPQPWTIRDVDIARRASHVPDAHKVRPKK
jgi:hypothetical protein